jgi:hypothetical protein
MIRKVNEIVLKNNYAIIKLNDKIFGETDCFIDIEDLPLVKQYFWRLRVDKRHPNCTPYVESVKRINGKRIRIHLHRLIMNCPNDKVVDHINHNGLDNRKKNLRICTQQINVMNRKNSTNIYYVKRDDIYVVSFFINGVSKNLCYTRDIKEAKYFAKVGKELISNGKINEFLNMSCKRIKLQKNNKTGYNGISQLKNGKYQVRYKHKYIGTVDSIEKGIILQKNYELQSQNNF